MTASQSHEVSGQVSVKPGPWLVFAALALCATGAGTLWGASEGWKSLGPDGGHIQHLAVDPRIAGTVYAATCGGFFKTTDGGTSWKTESSGLPVDCIQGLAVDPQNPNTLYAGTTIGVFKTTDAGASWRLTSAGNRWSVGALAIDPQDSGTLYAAGIDLYKSTDGGTTWKPLAVETNGTTRVIAIDPQTPSIVYVETGTGVVKSVDRGENWSSAGSGLPSQGITALALDPQNSGTLFVGTENGVFKTTDGGTSWTPASIGFPRAGLPGAPAGALIDSLVVSPQDPQAIFAKVRISADDCCALFKSINGGASWNASSDSAPLAGDVGDLVFDLQDPSVLYAGTNSRGIFKSTDGGESWAPANAGLHAATVGSLAFDPQTSGTLYAAITPSPYRDTLVAKSLDGGESWIPASFGLPRGVWSVALNPKNPSTVYAGGLFGVFKSTNSGETWTDTNAQAPIHGPLLIDPSTPDTLYVLSGLDGHQIFKSSDAGHTWVTLKVDFADAYEPSTISALRMDPQASRVLYVGTLNGDGTGAGVWKSLDGGASWTHLDALPTGDISTLAVDAQMSGTLYISQGRVSKSTDGGETWTDASSGLPLCCMFGPLIVDPQDHTKLYYAGFEYLTHQSLLYRSTDSGTSWSPVDLGFSAAIDTLTLDPQNSDNLYVGTSGGGLFIISLASLQYSK